MFKKKTNIYIDLDGTLAEWKAAASMQDLYKKGYFLNLRPNKDLLEVVERLCRNKNLRVTVLSHYLPDSAYAYHEKQEWIKRYLPKNLWVILVPHELSKASAVETLTHRRITKRDILIDDHSPNCVEWDRAGGTSIKFLNAINGAGRTWTGIRSGHDDIQANIDACCKK